MSTTSFCRGVFIIGVVWFSCEVSLCKCEVTLVTRNITDSFRIGQEGCKRNESVCSTAKASCQPDGLCLCNPNTPNFRNPSIVSNNGSYQYVDSYGCISEDVAGAAIDRRQCIFSPFQLVPNKEEPVTEFKIDGASWNSCSFKSAEAKYPINNTWNDITLLLDRDYLTFNNSNNIWSFQWKKPVFALQGAIIIITFRCLRGGTSSGECLKAKVSGTWSLHDANSQSTSTAGSSPSTRGPTSPPVRSSFSSSVPSSLDSSPIPFSSTTNRSPGNDDGSNTAVIIAAAMGALVFLIVAILISRHFLRRRNEDRGIAERSVDSRETKGVGHGTDAISQGNDDGYEDLHFKDGNDDNVYLGLYISDGAYENVSYEKPEVIYETPALSSSLNTSTF